MLQKLRYYYEISGILSTSFSCIYKNECQGNCETFTGPKSAFVSSGYCSSNNIPKLLFLSLDSGSGNPVPKNRLPLSVQHQEEIDTNILALHKGKHWYLTHELAWYILRQFISDIKIEETNRYFAHANAAKCCQNKEEKKKADKILFKNCQCYLQGELQILNPDILVTQGNEAKFAIQHIKDSTEMIVDKFASIILLNGKQVYWLHTYHPNSRQFFREQRDYNKETKVAAGWKFYSEAIQNFIKYNNGPTSTAHQRHTIKMINKNRNTSRKKIKPDILKEKLIRLVEEINASTSSTVIFKQQLKVKTNMSFFGCNGRIYIQPSSVGYDVSLSGKSVEKTLYPLLKKLFGKECDGYKQTNGNTGIITAPFWRTDNFDLVKKAVYIYAKS
jgi:hypothetical protein